MLHHSVGKGYFGEGNRFILLCGSREHGDDGYEVILRRANVNVSSGMFWKNSIFNEKYNIVIILQSYPSGKERVRSFGGKCDICKSLGTS